MKYKLADYKSKYFVIQDELEDEDYPFFPTKEMSHEDMTNEFLKEHVKNANYYGIPAYVGDDKQLQGRIRFFEIELEKEYAENK